MSSIVDNLVKYTSLLAPVGHELPVQKEFIKDIGYGQIDKTGNVICGCSDVAIVGHADEIAYYITKVTDDGFIKFSYLTGGNGNLVFPYVEVGQRVIVMGDKESIKGVFAAKSTHIVKTGDKNKPITYDDLICDTGLSCSDLIDCGVHVGTPIVYNNPTEVTKNKVYGKSMDDRVSHVIMIELSRKYKATFISTVQEEFGGRGSASLTGNYNLSIGIEIFPADDYLGGDIKLGAGPVLVWKDASIHYDVGLIHKFMQLEIPYQHGVFDSGSSDLTTMRDTRKCLIGIPCRYTHQPHEMVCVDDLNNTVRIIEKFLQGVSNV